MRVWTCKNFQGLRPLPTAAVVVAPTRSGARALLTTALRDKGIAMDEYDSEKLDIVELDLIHSNVRLMQTGDW